MDKCSLLIATYNWPEALELCLKSVLHQKVLPGEVIIADDGSRGETRNLIESFQKKFPVPLSHIWQPDEGFQLARIRNKGIAAANFPYIIQIDGDLILHPFFIKDHLQLGKKGYFTTGSRVLLSPETSQRLLENHSIELTKYSFGNRNFFNGLRSYWLRHIMAGKYKTKGKNMFYVKGCNMAFWKEDLLKVNGYNESFFGWGREDSELAIRLMNAGITKQFIKMGGICYHLYHKEASREMEEKNTQMMEDAIQHKTTWAEKGISQYLPG
jgi:glycosyltransferase involved in cell wall biosynthesis